MKVPTSLVASILLLLPLFAPTQVLAVVQNINNATQQSQTIQGDSNVTFTTNTGTGTHNLGWFGQLPVSRGGTGIGSFSAGSIFFFNGSAFAQDNSNFFWDDTNNRLGIGTSSPTVTLDVAGTAKVTNLTSSGDATINNLTAGLGGGAVSSNTAFGKDALLNAASSNYNLTGIGENALKNPVANKGDSVAIGSFALWTGGGDQNTSIGSGSMYNTTSGQYNTAVGFSALRGNTSGDTNVGLGWEALHKNTSGSQNIAIGGRAANFQADGSTNLDSPANSIYIGYQARGYDDNDDNSIVIGTNAIGAGANKTVLGNSSMTDVYFGSSLGLAKIHAANIATISSGTSAPSSTPTALGQIYIDTSAAKVYISTGTSSSTDWAIVN